MATESDREPWPYRAWLTTALGLLAALFVYLLLRQQNAADNFAHLTESRARISLAAFVATGAVVLAFTMERVRTLWSLGFALAAAVVAAGIVLWNGAPQQGADWMGWRYVCGLLAVAIAAPFFQVVRDEGHWALPYRSLHSHGWTNVVIWCAASVFVGIAWLLAWLLASLFGLIGIEALSRLLDKGWFGAMLSGGAFGGAIGLLRERDAIVALLQRVILAVLAVLAPVLGAGLLLFLLALPFTGLAPLWQATKSTTPILLGCVVAALILANDVIGDSPEDEAKSPPLRLGAMALAFCALPLALIAAISTGLRIHQYGLTPDRLWALTFLIVAVAYGLAYFVALLRGRGQWASFARPANVRLGLGLCILALLLSTPLSGFDAWSARDQEARLEAGRVSVADFGWDALAFDFGQPGRDALGRLTRNPSPAVRGAARRALASTDRWALREQRQMLDSVGLLMKRLRVVPKPVELPRPMLEKLVDWSGCRDANAGCLVRWTPGEAEAIVVTAPCDGPVAGKGGSRDCNPSVVRLVLGQQGWAYAPEISQEAPGKPEEIRAARAGFVGGDVEIREVRRRQVFVGGQPRGAVF